MINRALHHTAIHSLRLALIICLTASALDLRMAAGAVPTQLGSGWSPVSIVAPPEGRWMHGMTYDTVGERVLMFGGECVCQTKRNDLFAYGAGQWTTVYTDGNSAGPSQRMNVHNAFVYNPETNQTLLFGGLGANGSLSDTWLLKGSTWVNATPVGVNPAPRDAHAIAPFKDGYLMWGGQTADAGVSYFDGQAWSTQVFTPSPPLRMYHGMALDSARGVIVMFGGIAVISNTKQVINDTWELSPQGWRKVPTPAAPPARFGFAMAYDATTRTMLMFGGRDTADKLYDDTWSFDGVTWRPVGSTVGPSARVGAAMAFDSARNRAVLFGGNAVLTEAVPYSDTWQFVSAPVVFTKRLFLPIGFREYPQPLLETEDNNNTQQADDLPLSSDLRGVTNDAYDVFRVTVDFTNTLTVVLSDLPAASNGRVQLQLLKGSQQIAVDTTSPYQVSVNATPGEYFAVVFTDKANYPQTSPYRLRATQ